MILFSGFFLSVSSMLLFSYLKAGFSRSNETVSGLPFFDIVKNLAVLLNTLYGPV